MKRLILPALLTLSFVPELVAQSSLISKSCQDQYRKRLAIFRSATDDVGRQKAVDEMVRGNLPCFVQFGSRQLRSGGDHFGQLIKAIESERTDKQTTAPATGAGTSIISKGVAAKTIGLAAEAGALTETTKGQVVTISGTLAGFPTALVQKGLVHYCDERLTIGFNCVDSKTLRFLRRLSFGVSFDTSQSSQTVTGTPTSGTTGSSSGNSPQQVNFQANRHDISAVTARYEIWDRRDVTSPAFQKALKAALQKGSEQLTTSGQNAAKAAIAMAPFVDSLREPYKTWLGKTAADLSGVPVGPPDEEQLLARFQQLLSELIKELDQGTDFRSVMANLTAAIQAYDQAEDEFIDSIAVKPVISFEYVNNRPVGQTPVSTFRLIGEAGWGKNDITFNGAFGVYDSAQPVIAGQPNSRLRDIEGGVQYERKLGTLPLLGAAALDLSFYYQNQRSASVLKVDPTQPLPGITFTGLPGNATQVFAAPGDIRLGQLRFVLGPGGSSVRVPIAVSYSNRTDLINKPGWRAQVGISYDFDALLSK